MRGNLMIKNNKPSVLIAGAGPTGLVLALWLTQLGVRVRIIDKNEKPGQTSRALIVQARTLEFYNQINIAEEIIAAGIKLEHIDLRKNGHPLQTVQIGEIGKELTPYSFVLSFPQDDHEQLLLNHLNQLGIDVERNTELLSFRQTKEKVIAHIKQGEQQETVEVAYLCGCDGARSTTRKQLNINFPGGTYKHVFFVADVTSPTAITQGLQVGVNKTDFFLAFPVRSSKTVRLIGIVPQDKLDKEEIKFTDVQETLTKNMHIRITEVNWFSTYHVHHRVVPQFQVDRIFLAGDAAHIHSPVGGQGMNTGIGDAVNLAWKLAAVLGNKSPQNLLDTYELERLPFAKTLVSTTDRVFQIVTSTSFLGMAWRNLIFPYLVPLVFQYSQLRELFFKFISQIKVNYRSSPLSQKNQGTIQAGDRLPWVCFETTDNFHALKSLTWQVHIYGEINVLLKKNLQEQSIPIIQFPWTSSAHNQGLIHNAAYLIRPDGYISVIDLSPSGEEIKTMLIRIHC